MAEARVPVQLSVEPLRAVPLTGIGRYTLELVKGLRAHPGVDLRGFYANGRWIKEPASLMTAPIHQSKDWGARALRTVQRRWHKMGMQRRLRSAVFHGPNYFLPQGVEGGVVTVHDLSVLKYPQTHPPERVDGFERQLRESLTRCAHVITHTETVKREIVNTLGWDPARITAVPLAAAPSFKPHHCDELRPLLQRFALVDRGFTLCAATLEPRKGIARLVNAYRALPESLRNAFPLVLVGGAGWRNQELSALVESAQQQGWLRHFGYVAEQDLAGLMAGARVFAYPSFYEGYGLPIVEAMASGVPVITTNASCMPEVAGGAAMLIAPGDEVALRDALERALTDEHWRCQASAAGLRVAHTYSWQRCLRETVAVYQRVWNENT